MIPPETVKQVEVQDDAKSQMIARLKADNLTLVNDLEAEGYNVERLSQLIATMWFAATGSTVMKPEGEMLADLSALRAELLLRRGVVP